MVETIKSKLMTVLDPHQLELCQASLVNDVLTKVRSAARRAILGTAAPLPTTHKE